MTCRLFVLRTCGERDAEDDDPYSDQNVRRLLQDRGGFDSEARLPKERAVRQRRQGWPLLACIACTWRYCVRSLACLHCMHVARLCERRVVGLQVRGLLEELRLESSARRARAVPPPMMVAAPDAAFPCLPKSSSPPASPSQLAGCRAGKGRGKSLSGGAGPMGARERGGVRLRLSAPPYVRTCASQQTAGITADNTRLGGCGGVGGQVAAGKGGPGRGTATVGKGGKGQRAVGERKRRSRVQGAGWGG